MRAHEHRIIVGTVVGDSFNVPRRSRPPVPAGPTLGGHDRLSRRQLEVLALLSAGVTARGIASHLGLAEATVRNHIRGILRKLDCHSQLEAVALGVRLGLVPAQRVTGDGRGGSRRTGRPGASGRAGHG